MRLSLKETISKLLKGGICALPTETVYGLAASIQSPRAIRNVFRLKKRPFGNPLIIHTNNLENFEINNPPPHLNTLTKTFWPGPLTLILDAKNIPSIIRGNSDKTAFRVPNHPLTLKVINEVGPLVCPSANISNYPPATEPNHIEQDFGDDFPILDGGTCPTGLESTILTYIDEAWRIVRIGATSKESIEKTINEEIFFLKKESEEAIRDKFAHNKIKTKLSKYSGSAKFVLGYKERSYPHAKCFVLGSLLQPASIAKNLYKNLKLLDSLDIPHAEIDINLPDTDLFEAIKAKLQEAINASSR